MTERAPEDRVTSSARVRGLVRDNLHRLLVALLGFIAISATTFLVDVAVAYKVGAAALAAVGIGASLVWLGEPRASWLERRGFRSWAVAGPLLAAVAVLAVGYGLRPPQVDHQFAATLILLDASEAMGGDFDGATKLSVAASRIQNHVGRFELEQLGFATFGSSDCGEDEPLTERVAIAHNQADVIEGALPDVEATGRSNLVAAATRALGLLHDFEGKQRVVLVAGGLHDECGGDLRALRNEAMHFDVPIEWDLVGLGFGPEDRQAAAELGADPEVTLHFADSTSELEEVMGLLLFERPVREGLDLLESFLEDARLPLNDAVSAMNAEEYTEAEVHISDAAAMIDLGRDRFTRFTAHEEVLRALDGVAHTVESQLGFLAAAVPLLEEATLLDRRLGEEASDAQRERRNDAVASYNDVIRDYNAGRGDLTKEISMVLDELFSE